MNNHGLDSYLNQVCLGPALSKPQVDINTTFIDSTAVTCVKNIAVFFGAVLCHKCVVYVA